jgi:predicted glycosyltransferase involved in capsule biosynthesis
MFMQLRTAFEVFILPFFYYVSKAVSANFAHFDMFWGIYADCKCRLQSVKFFLCSLHNTLLLNSLLF